jgi:Flp pilus assembly protein TadD
MPHLVRAVELRPADGRARDLLGIQLAKRGDLREAVLQFDAAAAAAMPLQPNLAAEANFHAGEVLARAGDLDAAAARFREVLRLFPGDRDARSALDQIAAHQRSASIAGE